MNEYIFTRLAGDEAKSLAGVEPLNCSLFFHCVFSLLIFELFGASRTAPNGKKKRDRKCELAAPSKASKGFTRATNASPVYHKRDYSRAQFRSSQSVALPRALRLAPSHHYAAMNYRSGILVRRATPPGGNAQNKRCAARPGAKLHCSGKKNRRPPLAPVINARGMRLFAHRHPMI